MYVVIRSLIAVMLLCALAFGEEQKLIQLPSPDTTGGKPLMQVLKERHSTREFAPDTLTHEVLGNLLWAACGINRPESGKRTSPSAMNWQEIDVYLTTAKGVFLYSPESHSLRPIMAGDFREKAGFQPFVKEAPLNLVYVANLAKVNVDIDSTIACLITADAAFIAENVYLYCASAGLATVVRAYIDKDDFAKTFKLDPKQRVILAQTVGYPKK